MNAQRLRKHERQIVIFSLNILLTNYIFFMSERAVSLLLCSSSHVRAIFLMMVTTKFGFDSFPLDDLACSGRALLGIASATYNCYSLASWCY
jgi:hypothetical protein